MTTMTATANTVLQQQQQQQYNWTHNGNGNHHNRQPRARGKSQAIAGEGTEMVGHNAAGQGRGNKTDHPVFHHQVLAGASTRAAVDHRAGNLLIIIRLSSGPCWRSAGSLVLWPCPLPLLVACCRRRLRSCACVDDCRGCCLPLMAVACESALLLASAWSRTSCRRMASWTGILGEEFFWIKPHLTYESSHERDRHQENHPLQHCLRWRLEL